MTRSAHLLKMTLDEYIPARDELIAKDLIAFDGQLFQILSLPQKPVRSDQSPLSSKEEMRTKDPATVLQICRDSLGIK